MEQSINNAFVAVPAAVVTASQVSRSSVSSALKRLIDVVLAVVMLVTFSPLLCFVILALLVAQGRPLFISQRRVGRERESFACFKFRTMVVDADLRLQEHLANCPIAYEEWARTRKLQKDPRVTPFGAALRASSIDELPQLLNVLRGDMSLVGPRPVIEEELLLYGTDAEKYVAVRPGLTGSWQVSGRSRTSFAERVKLDVEYVDSHHVLKDLWILARTVPAVLFARGAV